MAPSQHTQLEKVIDEVFKSGDVQALEVFLQKDIYEGTPVKCSTQFLTKLDKLISKGLDQNDPKSASLGLAIIYKYGKYLKVPSGGLPEIIAQGLIKKMVQWFGKCRQLWIQCGPRWNETLFNLSEDFFEALMVVHEACKEGTYEITESFLYPVGQLVVDPRIYILIQKEAIRKFNIILDKIPVELKKERKIRTSQETSEIMIKLAGQILESGDYDFQTALMEALCRMASPDQRKELADRWFTMQHVANAFVKIHDSEFETDCRKFLNLVNGMQGDKRRVYSYPCLEAYLDKHELLMPTDEKLDEFWIDFNLGSHSISFYFSLADEEAQEGQWETICINENEVQSYTVTEKGKRQVLQLNLSEVVVVGAVEGSSLTIYFSSSLDILQAACSVYGQSKNKGFVGKTSTSIVKTTVKIIMDENSSQVVPESQVSLGESEKNTASYLLPTPSALAQTPARMRFSESTTFISSCSAGGSVHGASSLSAVMQSTNGKGKPSLEMVRSCDRQSTVNLGELRTTAKTCSHGTTPGSTKAGGMTEQSKASKQAIKNKVDMKKKNITLTKAVDLVLAGRGEDQSLENGFVPDTQPRTERSIFSSWNKLSVSEMLMMPTQKIYSLPVTDSCSSLTQQPEHLASGQKSSVQGSGPIKQKELHVQLTQRLQEVLNERSQKPAVQEPAAAQRKVCDIREDSKGRSSADQHGSTSCTSKEQQAKRNGPARGKNKGQMSLEADATAVKAPVKASTTNILQERTPNVKVKTNRALSRNEKRDAEVAGSMVKLISSRYEINTKSTAKPTVENISQCWIPPLVNRPIFNMSWQTNAKEKRYVKKHLFSDTDTDYAMTEVSWLRESSRKPKPKVTKYSKSVPVKPKAPSTHTSYESPDLPPPSPKPVKGHIKSKKPDVKKAVEQPKKTVKPAAAPDRQHAAGRRPQRAAATTSKSYKEPDTDDSQSESEKHLASKYSSTDQLTKTEKNNETAKMRKKKTGCKQPTKSSLKLENNYHSSQSESESVSEQPPISKKYFAGQQGKSEKTCPEVPEVKKRKNTSSEQSVNRRQDCNNQSDLKKPSGAKQQRPENVLQDTTKLNKTNVIPAQEQTNVLEESWADRQALFSPCPPFIERMRSGERSAPTLGLTFSPILTPRGSPLPASPNLPCQDTPSPVLLLPKPRSTVSSKGNFKPSSFYSARKKGSTSKTQSIQSVSPLPSLTSRDQTPAAGPPNGPRATETSPVQQCLFSAPRPTLSLSTCPLLTSTFLEPDKPSLPSPPQSSFPEDTVNHGHIYGFNKVSPVSRLSLSQSSVLSSRVKDSPAVSLAMSHKTEKTPSSERDLMPAQLHISGPIRKRHISLSSNSEEDEREERKKSKMRGQRSPRMRPRKLFKSFAEVPAEGGVSRVTSSSHTVSSSHWEAEVASADLDMDEDLDLPDVAVHPSNLCQQFSSELKKKFQSRSKMMEVYNKQSLKTVQQHVSSLNTQVTKYRTQRLAQVQKVLLEEIHKLEQDDTVLKNMEKDLTMYWKKQVVAFHSFQEQDTRRNETLKNALQSNVCHSLEYEERIFTSQMCLIRKDMKSVQDRLLGEMQDGEIKSVKRGLHSLFFPDGGRF
ncbi:synaptonemal complex protein 2 [Scomber japonicus]|uniref:synaptonemal complex protein 2 n=1 Tax=Scomber japonicus TaxID=13676 RepID=UPI002306B8B6|nr:synaptonemal complex protein 2 [Scomber japonicus]